MVMIPVGNRTRHNFGLWCFFEAYIRIIITSVVIVNAQDVLPRGSLRALVTLFFIWSFRPIYISFKHIFYSWRDAKHKSESDTLSEESG